MIDADALFRKWYQPIYFFMLDRAGDEAVADDLAATVFLKVVKAEKTGRGAFRQEGNEAAWLWRIARNTWYDHLRGRRNTVPLEDVENVVFDERGACDHDLLADLHEVERAARWHLTEEQAGVMELQLQGYTACEIAAMQHKEMGAVKALRHRAIARLRKSLCRKTA